MKGQRQAFEQVDHLGQRGVAVAHLVIDEGLVKHRARIKQAIAQT